MQGGLRPMWLAICQYGWNQPDNYMKEQLSEEYTNHVPVAYTCTGGYRELFVSFENIFVESVQVLCLVKSGDVTLPAAAIQGMESQIKFEKNLRQWLGCPLPESFCSIAAARFPTRSIPCWAKC